MRRTRRQCHGDREGHAPESRHHVASESIEFEFLDRGVVVCVGECCCCGGEIFLCSGGRERRSVNVMVWILREEGSVFLGGGSVPCPCV